MPLMAIIELFFIIICGFNVLVSYSKYKKFGRKCDKVGCVVHIIAFVVAVIAFVVVMVQYRMMLDLFK